MSTLKSVREFHNAFGITEPEKPIIDHSVAALRVDLLFEEVQEMADAVDAEDIDAVLDALIDIQYVLDGVPGPKVTTSPRRAPVSLSNGDGCLSPAS